MGTHIPMAMRNAKNLPLHDDLAEAVKLEPPTITIKPQQPTLSTNNVTVKSNDEKLLELAIWFRSNDKLAERATQSYQAEMIRLALVKADIIKEGRALTSSAGFETWTKEMLGIGSSLAYSYLKLLDNPELVDFAVHTSGQIEINHIFALLPKRNESEAEQIAREEIKERIDGGETVSVREINDKLKAVQAENKRLEQDNKKIFDANQDLHKQANSIEQHYVELKDKYDTEIEVLVDEQLKTKLPEIEQQALTLAAAQYQETIDAQAFTLSSQRAELASIKRTGEQQQIEAEIADKQSRLRQLNKQVSAADKNEVLREVMIDFLKQVAEMKMVLKVESQHTEFEARSIELLKTARHEIREFEQQLNDVITRHDDTVDIED